MQYRSKDLDFLVNEVIRSPKCKNILTDFIRRVGLRELGRNNNIKEAVKATKNRLHQVAGAFFTSRIDYLQLKARLNEAVADREEFKAICRQAMRCHASTRERLVILDDFYALIFSRLPSVNSILDIGCGLNPMAIPWMPLGGRVKYYAFDIYHDLADFLNAYFQLIDINGHAEVCDVMTAPPKTNADIAFVLKMITCLESIEPSAGIDLLERINAKCLVVSFPVQSLGGKNKNMLENYKTRFNALIREKTWTCECLEFKSELVYLVLKNAMQANDRD